VFQPPWLFVLAVLDMAEGGIEAGGGIACADEKDATVEGAGADVC